METANGGTLFLDEVGELPARAQAKLLRVVQEGEIRRVGENSVRRVDVQLLAATNRNLADEVAAGRFRQDLLFRLAVVCLPIPPLRQRAGDVELLVRHFWAQELNRAGKRATLASETLAALARYHWPGNVRELQNVTARLAVEAPRRGAIGPEALPASIREHAESRPETLVAARLAFDSPFRARRPGPNGRSAGCGGRRTRTVASGVDEADQAAGNRPRRPLNAAIERPRRQPSATTWTTGSC